MSKTVLIDRLRCPRSDELEPPEALLDWLEPWGTTRKGRPFTEIRSETADKIAARLGGQKYSAKVEEWLLIWAGSPTTPPFGPPPAELIALQLEAQSIVGGAVDHLSRYAQREDVVKVRTEQGAFIRAFVQSMILQTQEEMQGRGIERVTLWRGAKEISVPGQAQTFKVVALPLQPITSFTHELAQAVRFTGRRKGTLFSVSVPASRILATPVTGLGVLQQREEIVYAMPPSMGMLDEGFVAQSDDWEDWQEISSYGLPDWVELLREFESQQEEST